MSDIPEPVNDQERWIVKNTVVAVRTYFKFTSEDAADDYIELTSSDGKKVNWLQSTFHQVATLRLSGPQLTEPKYGLREKVNAREKWEKNNAAELATYRRLHKKYGTGPHKGGVD